MNQIVFKKLADVCQVIAGQSPPSSSYNQENDGVPFFQGKADFNEKHPTVRYWCNEPKKMSTANDILMSVRAPVGAININDIDACIGRGLAAIRCGHEIDLDFLYNFLKSQTKQIQNLGSGSTFKAITIKTLKSIKIPIPPLETQKQIAETLDNAAALRDKTQQLLAEYDQLARSIFLDMFEDQNEITIEKLLNNKTLILHKDGNHGGNYPRKEEFDSEGIPFLSAKNINDQGQFDYSNVEFLNFNKARKLTIGWLKKDDVLLSHNASVGKVTRYNGFFEEALIGTSLTCFRTDKTLLNPYYLQYHLMSPFFYRQLEKIMSQSTRNQVPITAQRKLKLIVPNINMQNQFAEKIALIEQQKELAKQELQESEDLFQALLQNAFKGELI